MSDITQDQATAIAQKEVAKYSAESKKDFVLLPAETKAYAFGWVFRYNTAEFIRTKDYKYLVPGANPFAVTHAGAVVPLPFGAQTDAQITQYVAEKTQSLTLEQATDIARAEVANFAGKSELDLVLTPDPPREYPFGWVFYYNSKRYLETNDPHFATLGNGPLIVNRDGSSGTLTSSMDPDVAIQLYLKKWKKNHPAQN